MKTNLSRMLRSGIAMLLVLCMVAGVIPSVVFATEESNEINYVSLGDSMTNGYCFTGYEQGNITASQFFAGEGVYGDAAYPNQFAAWLEETTGKTVNHAKLAVSAMRAEDLNYLLGGREMPTDGWFDQILHYSGVEDDAALAAFYQEKIENADVITMSVGNAAFGAYLVQYITRAMGVLGGSLPEEEEVNLELAIAELNDEQKALVMDVYGMAMDSLTELIPAELAEEYNVDAACDVIAYCTAGYLLNYKSVLEQIMERNPDVQIVLVGLMNTTYGMEITMGDDFSFAIGDFMDDAFGLLNAYMAGLPATMQFAGEWTDAEFYYAAQPQPEFIVQVYDDLYNDGWPADYDRLSGTIVRSRTMKAYNEALRPMIGLALGFNLPEVTLADVDGYVAIGDEPDSYKASYLFTQEIAVLMGGGAPGPLVSGYLAAYPGDYSFGHAKEYLTPEIEKEISIAIYLALEEALASSVGTMEITVEGLEGIGGGDIFGALGEMPEALNPANNPGPVTIREALVGWFTGSETSRAMCKIFALFKVGDGMSVHPTPAAHDDIAESVIAAYGEYTAKDETEANIKIVLSVLRDLVKEYGPDVAAEVWAQWVEHGYVEAIETSVADLIEAAKARYTYYTEEALPSIDAAVVELNATNDALTVELDALYAQLAAKEAELAEVLKNQEIGSVTLPNINIDATLGGNTPTEVPDHDCEGEVAELEAAIADLKHAIAVTEALIADVSADIADMVALAEQIADAIAELSETVKQIVAAGEDLLAAFNAVKDVLSNGVITSVDATIRAFEAARATAIAAANVVELVTDNANAITADIAAMAADMVADGEALINKLIVDVPASVAQAPEEVKAAVGAAMLAAEFARVFGAEDLAKAELDELLAKADAEYYAKKAELEARAEELKAEIADLEAKIAAHIEEKFPVAAEYAKAGYAAAIVELEARAEELNEELLAWTAELDKALVELAGETAETIEAAVAPIKAQIARVEKDLATINADLACACAHLDVVLAAIYDEAVAEAAALYAAAKAEYEAKMAEVLAELEALEAEAAAKLAAAKAELEAAIADATAKYEAAKAALESHVEEKLAQIEAELEAAIADATAKYEAAKAALEAEVAAKKAAVEAELKAAALKVKDTAAKLDAAVKNAYETAVDEANRIYGEALMAAKNELQKVQDTIENLPGYIAAEVNSALATALKNALSKLANLIGSKLPGMNTAIFEDMSAAVLDKLSELGIGGINGLLGYKGTADLVVGEGFTYVALGDGSAEPKSYVEKLAALLDAEAKANGVSGINYVNAAVSGNTVAAERANLTAAVKDADLVTLGFSNVTFLANALNVGLGLTEAEFDWVALVGEQGAAYVADLLANVQLEVANSGVTGMAADIINTTIEAVAYYTIEYVVELPSLISDIKAVNPDAVIAVIGMYNPLKDVVITLDGNVGVEVSEYVDYLVNGVTLFGNAYSLLSGDCIFVQVGDVATKYDQAELGIYDLIGMVKEDFASLNPSEAGHETILAALAAALNITYYVEPEMGLLGDADGDGVVSLADAQVIMQAYVGEDVAINLNVCDLDGDGVVGLLDAQLIMQWYVGDIANFPVEQ